MDRIDTSTPESIVKHFFGEVSYDAIECLEEYYKEKFTTPQLLISGEVREWGTDQGAGKIVYVPNESSQPTIEYIGPPIWISVTDRLPDEGVSVLAISNDFNINETPEIIVAAYVRSRWQMNWDSTGDYLELVTHWMRLPKPPKEV